MVGVTNPAVFANLTTETKFELSNDTSKLEGAVTTKESVPKLTPLTVIIWDADGTAGVVKIVVKTNENADE